MPLDQYADQPEDEVEVFIDDENETGSSSPSIPHDQWTVNALSQIDRLQNPRSNWVTSILTLVGTLILFIAIHFVDNTPKNLAILLAVLLIHESGHFAGMKIFGYRNVKMFFLPFFGAAVSGTSRGIPGWKAGTVILLGPLPGIVIGLALGIAAVTLQREVLRSAALVFIGLNGLNLLPLLPLDGGRLMQLTLFGRQRHLEALFQGLTGILAGLIGLSTGSFGFAIAGAFMLFTTRNTFRMNSLAQKFREEMEDAEDRRLDSPPEKIPTDIALNILGEIRPLYPNPKQAQLAAVNAVGIWDRIHLKSPDLFGTFALLGVYAFSVIAAVAIFTVLIFYGPAGGGLAH